MTVTFNTSPPDVIDSAAVDWTSLTESECAMRRLSGLECASSTPSGSLPPRKRLLLVAYCFPPVGGAGVQRPVKWVKYLQRFGWDVTVLTPSNPSVPVLDDSLLADIPPETKVVRAKTWEPGYAVKQQMASARPQRGGSIVGWVRSQVKSGLKSLAKLGLQPDPQILWYPHAVRAATRELRRVRHDAILCTAPPFSSLLIGRTLKRRFGLPLLLDFRDEWDLSSRYLEQAQRDRLSQWVQERQQRSALRAADAVIATTQASVDRLGERLSELKHPVRQTCIYNGYDTEDFRDQAAPPTGIWNDQSTFRLVYTGTLWNLTDVSPLVQAIERLQQQSPRLAQRLEFVCIGRKTAEQQQQLDRLRSTDVAFTNRGYCDHDTVLDCLQSADGLCLLLSDVPGAERVVPAKLFEYLASRREMLTIAPLGEAWTIAQRCQPDGCFTPQDVPGICHWLAERIAAGPRSAQSRAAANVEFYSRERQTAKLAELLDQLTAAPSGKRGASCT